MRRHHHHVDQHLSDGKRALLATIPLFQSCSPAELDELERITTDATAAPGEVLCYEGRLAYEFVVVVNGIAELTIEGDRIGTAGPGDFFGEIALLDGKPQVATVTAVTAMDLLVLTRREFVDLLAEVPAAPRRILHRLCALLRRADEELRLRHLAS